MNNKTKLFYLSAIIVLYSLYILVSCNNNKDTPKTSSQLGYQINNADEAIMIASEHIETNYPGFFDKIKDNLIVEETDGVWTVHNVWPPRKESGFTIYTYGGVVEVKLDKNSGELISIVFHE